MHMDKKQFNEPYSHVKVQGYVNPHDYKRMNIAPIGSGGAGGNQTAYWDSTKGGVNYHSAGAGGIAYLNQGSELTSEEVEALYWKLLAPLNYKVLEGRYFLVCPVCDVDLGHAKDYLHSKDDFKVEVHYGTKARSKHEAECKATPEA